MRFSHVAVILAFSLGGCVSIDVDKHAALPPAPPAPVALPFDGFGVIAGPPVNGTPQKAADLATSLGPWTAERTAIAARDDAFDPFSALAPVLGADFTAANYPAAKAMFDQFLAVAGPAIGATKARWQVPRPFVANPAHPTCITPSEALRASGSYPSGHSTGGWGWALLMAEVAPDKGDALLHRGFEYGESRIVCGVHWASDVAAGRALGGAAVARMHGDPGSRALIEAAHAEYIAKNAR